MNLSGRRSDTIWRRKKFEKSNLFIVVDDLHIPYGTIGRPNGSDAGHNGLKDMTAYLKYK